MPWKSKEGMSACDLASWNKMWMMWQAQGPEKKRPRSGLPWTHIFPLGILAPFCLGILKVNKGILCASRHSLGDTCHLWYMSLQEPSKKGSLWKVTAKLDRGFPGETLQRARRWQSHAGSSSRHTFPEQSSRGCISGMWGRPHSSPPARQGA